MLYPSGSIPRSLAMSQTKFSLSEHSPSKFQGQTD
jgi:hypothetical protein